MRIGPVHASMRSLTMMMMMRIALSAGLALLVSGCTRGEGVVSGEYPMTSDGGSIVVQCIDGDLAKLMSWQPKPGYDARVIVPGPSAQVSILFESGVANDFRVAVHCVDGFALMDQFDDEETSVG